MNEFELINKIKEKPGLFSELFKIYYKPIFGYIFRRTGSFDDSADIAADTFLKAFTHIKNFSYKGISIKVWLYRIAINELNQFYRHKKKHNTLFERLNFNKNELFKTYFIQDKEKLETEFEKHNQFMSVLKALKTLPNKYQEPISLRYFEGFDNKEIAEILNIKEGTLKSLLSRGLNKLRKECNQF